MKTVWFAGLGAIVVGVIGYAALTGDKAGIPQEAAMETQAGSSPEQSSAVRGAAMVQVSVPALEGAALIGERVFNAKCAVCHGRNAAGQQGIAPPLVHKIYEPGHHGDGAFMLAARTGVRAHHWRFGDMPPVEGVTDAEIDAIVAYVRALQKASGIF